MKEFSLEFLNSFIENGNVDSCTHDNVKTGFDISPNEFLKFAEYDLTAKYDHHLVNSLSNTKRAIDSQLDFLLIGFGLSERSKKWNFPTKINFLNSVGIISPRILNKINKKRNLLEHEYKNPNKEDVEDALDVAELFVNYTNKYLFQAVDEFELSHNDEERSFITIKLDWKNGKLIFVYPKRQVTEELTAEQTEYEEYLKFYIGLYNRFGC